MTNVPQPGDSGAKRLAAIDVGTNSIRLIVAEALPDGTYKLIDDEKETGRLGRGLASTGELAAKAMDQAATAITRMVGIARGYGVVALRAVGTAAVRDAANREAFCEMVEQRAGVPLEVIDADEEARLAHLSVTHAFDLRHANVAVVDIGGGSTEIILASGGVIEQIVSIPVGAMKLTELFTPGGEADAQAWLRMKRYIRKELRRGHDKPLFVPQFIVGTGGTFTTLAGISIHRAAGAASGDMLPFTVRGYEMQRSEVKHLLLWLRDMPLRARTRVRGLSPDRAEIIVAGVSIVESVMKHLDVNTLRVHDRGIRDGLLIVMIKALFPHVEPPRIEGLDRLRVVRQFASSLKYEEAHSEHVARLSVLIFDQLAAQLAPRPGSWADPVNRELLEAAAVLHDVGYYINYAKHHKHSYHLIIHSDLPGFTPREVEIMANLARYHRRSEPKAKHANFAKLNKADQDLVLKLAAILRIADGFDRTHTQVVHDVRVQARRGKAAFIVTSTGDAAVDIWGAERKAALLKEAFDLNPHFETLETPAIAAGKVADLGADKTPPQTQPKPAVGKNLRNGRKNRVNADSIEPDPVPSASPRRPKPVRASRSSRRSTRRMRDR